MQGGYIRDRPEIAVAVVYFEKYMFKTKHCRSIAGETAFELPKVTQCDFVS